MQINMLKAVLYLLTAFFSGSHQQCFSDDDRVPSVKPEQFNHWVESGHRFSVSLFQHLDKTRNYPNILFSPWSIQEALLLAYFGAEGETAESLATVLQIRDRQDKPLTWELYRNQRALHFRNDISNTLKSANKIFFSNQLFLRTCMEVKFKNEFELMDYQTDVDWAQKYINDWIAKQTEGHITDLIQGLSPFTKATLANAVFYKGKWLSQFNPNQTEFSLFRVKDHKWRSTSFMQKSDVFEHGYSEVLGARMLMLPYVGNSTAMIVLLPDKDLDTTIESLNAATLRYISDRRNYKSAYFELIIPKYRHKTKTSLHTVLEKLGIGNALTPSADFSGFTGRKEVFFSEADHEAEIQVDEEGTMATAATGFATAVSMFDPLDFHCTRPFAYIIYDFVLNKVLFMGTYREPRPI